MMKFFRTMANRNGKLIMTLNLDNIIEIMMIYTIFDNVIIFSVRFFLYNNQ